jgi:deazaflavin-dependent oxidoreductase (nitroreductase family)
LYEYGQTNAIRRFVRRTASLRPMSWLYARTAHHLDRLVYRLSRGRANFTTWVTGLPIVMLTTTGAKSGRKRTLPVVGVPEEGRLIVIASNYGQRHHPAWYHNLRAHPRATIAFEGEARAVEARELTGDERERWYARGIEIYPGWTYYRKRASNRQIPVIELVPVGSSG